MSSEQDAKVAELLDWTPTMLHVLAGGIPHFTTDARADYTVLEFVRTNWTTTDRFETFCESLTNAAYYQAGDYSRAALAVMGESDG